MSQKIIFVLVFIPSPISLNMIAEGGFSSSFFLPLQFSIYIINMCIFVEYIYVPGGLVVQQQQQTLQIKKKRF